MWSWTEMQGLNQVILVSFMAALYDPITDTASLSAGAKANSKKWIRCVRYITDFCPMARYRRHIPQTKEYMDEYLRKFHDNLHVFSEFWVTKKDHQSAKEASGELAVDQREARQGKLEQYLQLSTTKRMNMAMEEWQHQQRIFGALTPCCGARAPGLCTIASSASGASRAPRRHRPRSLPPGRPNSSDSGRNWGDFSRNYGACGALTPAFWDRGVRAPSVRTVAFYIVSLPLDGAGGAWGSRVRLDSLLMKRDNSWYKKSAAKPISTSLRYICCHIITCI